MRAALVACIARDPQWKERSKRALAEVRYADTSLIRPEAIASREAFDLAAAGQTSAAAHRLQEAVNDVENPSLRGWLLEQKAAYVHHTDSSLAQRLLSAAIRENSFVLCPAAGIAPAPIRPTAVQARAAAAFLAEEYGDGISLVLGVRALLDEIQWDEERTEEAERAWERLGRHLGFSSTQPEKLWGRGPDNLWALSAGRHAVTELKTGCTGTVIAKKDLDQLGGSVRWDQERHRGIQSLPVMVHPSCDCNEHGTAVPNMRVVTPRTLEQLKLAVRAFAVALADGQGRWGDEQAVATQLAHHKLDAGNVFQEYAEPTRAAPCSAVGAGSGQNQSVMARLLPTLPERPRSALPCSG